MRSIFPLLTDTINYQSTDYPARWDLELSQFKLELIREQVNDLVTTLEQYTSKEKPL
jgi:hypothetical protein